MPRCHEALFALSLLSAALIISLPALAGTAGASSWETAPAGAAGSGLLEQCPINETSDADAGPRAIQGERDQPPYQSGWPQTMGYHPNYRPAGVMLADLDRDSDFEVLCGSTDQFFYVWRHDGTLMPGWPVNLGGMIQAKAAVADLDGDGDLEIIVNTRAGQLHVLHHDATPLSGWPQSSGMTGGFRAPTVYDLDDDGIPEVMIGGSTQVTAWRADGSVMPGFPQPVGATITSTLAVGDITGDGLPEIFAESVSGLLYSFQIDGTTTPGWPANFGLSNSYAAPSIGDLDGDGQREVLVAGYQIVDHIGVFAYNGDGTLVAGFPINYPGSQSYSCPALADADGDGDLEIWHVTKGSSVPHCYAWDHNGVVLPGWPIAIDPNTEGSPIVADLDGDPGLEFAVADNVHAGVIHGFELDGTITADFPIDKLGGCGPNGPEVGDIDGDGDLELAFVGMTAQVTIWDLPVAYHEPTTGWGALFHDDWNTNQYGFVPPVDLAAVPSKVPNIKPRLLAHPNPFTPRTTLSFSLAEATCASLRLFDVRGRQVATLLGGKLAAGTQTCEWDAREAASGVYLAKLETPRGCTSLRLVLLK